MAKRTLSLRRESLVELTTDELSSVAGAAGPPTGDCLTKVPSYAQHTCIDCLTRNGCD